MYDLSLVCHVVERNGAEGGRRDGLMAVQAGWGGGDGVRWKKDLSWVLVIV